VDSEGSSSEEPERQDSKPILTSDVNLRKSAIVRGEMEMIPEDANEEDKQQIEEEEEEVSSSYEEGGEDEMEDYSSSLLKKDRQNTGEDRVKKGKSGKMASSVFITSS
jgi:hypothetical protein